MFRAQFGLIFLYPQIPELLSHRCCPCFVITWYERSISSVVDGKSTNVSGKNRAKTYYFLISHMLSSMVYCKSSNRPCTPLQRGATPHLSPPHAVVMDYGSAQKSPLHPFSHGNDFRGFRGTPSFLLLPRHDSVVWPRRFFPWGLPVMLPAAVFFDLKIAKGNQQQTVRPRKHAARTVSIYGMEMFV